MDLSLLENFYKHLNGSIKNIFEDIQIQHKNICEEYQDKIDKINKMNSKYLTENEKLKNDLSEINFSEDNYNRVSIIKNLNKQILEIKNENIQLKKKIKNLSNKSVYKKKQEKEVDQSLEEKEKYTNEIEMREIYFNNKFYFLIKNKIYFKKKNGEKGKLLGNVINDENGIIIGIKKKKNKN